MDQLYWRPGSTEATDHDCRTICNIGDGIGDIGDYFIHVVVQYSQAVETRRQQNVVLHIEEDSFTFTLKPNVEFVSPFSCPFRH